MFNEQTVVLSIPHVATYWLIDAARRLHCSSVPLSLKYTYVDLMSGSAKKIGPYLEVNN